MSSQLALNNAIASKNGLSVIACSAASNVVDQAVKHILENDTPTKGTIICSEELAKNVLSNTTSEHSVLKVNSKEEDAQLVDWLFDQDNKTATHRHPDMIVVGNIDDGNTVTCSIQAAVVGVKVIGSVVTDSISDIIPTLIDLVESTDKTIACYDLVNAINVLGLKTEDGFGQLVFNKAIKASLHAELEENGFTAQGVKNIIDEVLAQGA